ncbi:MAG: CRISPR-associated protein Cas5 [Isosphaeraceae bacterium]|nr:CRISPR-associated protein Cas5 [Isosphaeraceae bacterium]
MTRRLCAIVALLAFASVSRASFSYPDFSDITGLTLNGDAAQVGNRLRLTASKLTVVGSAFSESAILLGPDKSFSTYFQFQISRSAGSGDRDGIGADGLVFVIQTVPDKIGGAGGGMGYLGIPNSVGIEFDTFDNGPGLGLGDLDGNHAAINLDGVLAPLDYSAERRRFNDGGILHVWIDYDGEDDFLEVRWALIPQRPFNPILELSIDLAEHLGTDTAFVGFTSATGGAFGDHDILTWEFRGDLAPVQSVPEPSTLVGGLAAILGIALGSVGRARRSGR